MGCGTYEVVAKAKHRDISQAQIEDSFMRGFGIALASIWGLHHDGSMVASVMKHNGFKLDDFEGIDLVESEFESIRQALAGRPELQPKNVCPRCQSADDVVEATNYGRRTGRKHCRKCNLTLVPDDE